MHTTGFIGFVACAAVAAVSLVVRTETAQPTALAPLVMAAARGISRALKLP